MGIFGSFSKRENSKEAASSKPQDEISARGWPKGHRILGRYEVIDIKHGGMGFVYLCYDHEFQSQIAIKTFQDKYLNNKQVIDRFLLEAESWMRLEKHKNIVWAKWVSNINSNPHIFMEYIIGDGKHGLDLSGWIGSEELTLELCLKYAIQICTGMIYAQRKFIQLKRPFVHRDLKPANILVSKGKIAKITDFGLAKVCAQYDGDVRRKIDNGELEGERFSFSKTGNICGTPPYMSPEQWKAEKDMDIRSDIYSFGCVLYEMITGSLLFKCSTLSKFKDCHLNLMPKPVNKLNLSIPDKLDSLIMKCLEKKPENRFSGFEEIRNELNGIIYKVTGERVEYKDEGEELLAADLSNIAMALEQIGRTKEAITYYNRIIARIIDEISPEMVARVLNNRGNCHSKLGNHETALANYELAKRVDLNYDFPWHNSSGSYMTMGNYDKALEESNKAIKINPGFADSYARRADIHYRFKDYKKAIEDCNRAIELEPKHTWAYRTRKNVHKALKK